MKRFLGMPLLLISSRLYISFLFWSYQGSTLTGRLFKVNQHRIDGFWLTLFKERKGPTEIGIYFVGETHPEIVNSAFESEIYL
jgi:hypothetical protein